MNYPSECSCGAMDIESCVCGTTPADWARANRESTTTTEESAVPTTDHAAEYRRLQLLGVAPEVIAPLLDYVDALNAQQLQHAQQYRFLLKEDGTLAEYFTVDPNVTGAAKYLQVVRMRPAYDSEAPGDKPQSVHSVVNKVTGEVSKSAGWKGGPAKSTSKARKGQPIVAYELLNADSYHAMLARLDVHGGYLYSK